MCSKHKTHSGNKFIQNGFCAWNCQGQEYDYVVLPMTMQYGIMLYRNLVYTAITRARRKVFLFGDPNAFSYAAGNDRETIRNSWLRYLVVDAVAAKSKTDEKTL